MKDVHDKTWRMVNVPHIDVICEKIDNGSGTIAVTVLSYKGKEIFHSEKNIRVTKHRCSVEFILEQVLVNAKSVEVTLIISNDVIIHEQVIRLHRIYGRITDFANKPIQAYVWALPVREMPNVSKTGFDGTVIKADEKGNYELWLPEEHIAGIFIDDESYHKTSYECWVWDVNLKKDIEINPRIDKIELYNLRVWQTYLGENVLHVHFIPCSISTGPKKPLTLHKDNVRVYINDKQCEIKTFTEHHPWKMGSEPSYILDIEPKIFNTYNSLIRVEVNAKTKVRRNIIKEKGEAYFLGFF